MASKPKRLTAAYIENLEPGPARYEVGDPAVAGLQLRVETTGTKHWQLRYYWQGKRVKLALGTFPVRGAPGGMTLEQARTAALKAREQIDAGIDPRRADRTKHRGVPGAGVRRRRKEAEPLALTPEQYSSKKTPSPVEAAIEKLKLEHHLQDPHSLPTLIMEYLRRHVRRRRRRPVQAEYYLAAEVLPKWGTRDARTITPREVIELLDGMVDRGAPVAANRLASLLGQMFRFGIHRQIVEISPVQLLYRPGGKEQPRDHVLNDDELRFLLRNLSDAARFQTGDPARSPRLTHALKILMLTGQRRGELMQAQWRNVHLDGADPHWFIPAADTKTLAEHKVPLCPLAVQEFRQLKRYSAGSIYVMPGRDQGKKPSLPSTLTRGLARNMARLQQLAAESDPPLELRDFNVHDLRRTCRTYLSRLKVDPRVAEAILNHKVDGVEGVYDRYLPYEEMRAALLKWERFLISLMDGETITADDLLRKRLEREQRRSEWRKQRQRERKEAAPTAEKDRP